MHGLLYRKTTFASIFKGWKIQKHISYSWRIGGMNARYLERNGYTDLYMPWELYQEAGASHGNKDAQLQLGKELSRI